MYNAIHFHDRNDERNRCRDVRHFIQGQSNDLRKSDGRSPAGYVIYGVH